MLCSSFTKTIAPGLRIGWIAPGRYYDRLLQMKYAASGTNVPSTQLRPVTLFAKATITATCEECGRSTSAIWRIYTCWLREFFPCGICVTRPKRRLLCCGSSCRSRWNMVCVAKQAVPAENPGRAGIAVFRIREIPQLLKDQLRSAADREA
ncbi:transcriptional regulator [Klebsiella oxytoca]|nr:transcriptional regulator [Klebsiella oxytoca]